MNAFPYVKDLVFIGGGHTHALVLRSWGMDPLPGVRLTVIDPSPRAAYSGMLPGFVAGHYERDELDIDLIRLARFAKARVIAGAVSAIDPVAKLVTVPGRPPIAYDACAIDVGITSDMPALKGFADHAVPAKPLGPFASKWAAFRANALNPEVAVIGGGVAGAELAMAMGHALRLDGHTPIVHLIDRSKVLTALRDTTRDRMRKALAENGVEVHEDAPVAAVTSDGVLLQGGRLINSDFTAGAAGAKPHDWHADTGLELHDGYIKVDANLQTSDPSVFAVGDCAHLSHSPRPKAGVYAVREAPFLLHNLRAVLSGGPLKPYNPQSDYLKLISLGEKSALAEKWGRVFSGSMMWRWKDRIDRKFMDQFAELQMIGQPDLPALHAEGLKEALGDKPMCGGCGAKVGPEALEDALSIVTGAERADVERLDGDDAGLIGGTQVISTDHLRAIVDDPFVMTRITAVHALGDIWAMGAKPQAATVNLVLPKMSDALQRRTLAEVMSAASGVLGDAGAAIAGGHTSLGAELTIGFTITGLCDVEPITRSSGQAGDVLILTKPIGSGVIMAAEMQGKARGNIVVEALEVMQQGQGAAAAILRDAHAMTDVTGFGLAGHLKGLCEASNVGAEIAQKDVPLMSGAEDLVSAGIRSSLYDANRSAVALDGSGARFELFFDPQTAGGLLAAVPSEGAEALLSELTAAGYPAAIIGRLVKSPGLMLR